MKVTDVLVFQLLDMNLFIFNDTFVAKFNVDAQDDLFHYLFVSLIDIFIFMLVLVIVFSPYKTED